MTPELSGRGGPAVPGKAGIRVRRLAFVGLVALTLLAIGGVLGARPATPPPHPTATPAVPGQDRLAAAIERAQQRLRLVPKDYVTWAGLGSAYLERARVTADPSYYPKAEGALDRSLQLRPQDNPDALSGLGALANARHDFAGALGWAQRALRVDPYHADAYGVLADAQTQLGHADAATAAVQHMLDLRPGLAAYARASYDLEQHGRVDEAGTLMRQALYASVDPADVAFCRYQLGELEWQAGRVAGADREYAAGLAADPGYLPLLQGRAKVEAARGRLDAALADYADVTRRYPSPGYFIEYAELLRAAGQPARAHDQLALADAAQRLFTANGGSDDLTGAALALAASRPAQAVRLARQEWQRRQHADVADALAWALHANGQDAPALRYARRAGALGPRNARYSYHLGMIELGLGDRAAARRDLMRALDINRYFSPLDAPAAARTLSQLDAS
jgi:tetratricopeptide (TPR) repeat protein